MSVILTNTRPLDTILNSMEQVTGGASAGRFAVVVLLMNIPLAFLIPSSSGHATLAMPLLAPLSDYGGVSRSRTITAWILGHGLTLLFAPTSVVLVGGLAFARVGYNRYLKFAWPLLLLLLVTSSLAVGLAATVE